MSDERKARGRNFKSYCNSICSTCNTIFYVSSAKRYCYEDKFLLPQASGQERVKIGKYTQIVLDGFDGVVFENGVFEGGYAKMEPMEKESYTHIVKEACIEYGIEYTDFMETIKNIQGEVRNEN